MAKILVTGMNGAQCKENAFLTQQLGIVPSQYSLVRCLRDMGHQVEQRKVELGEDLSKYWKVIVYVSSPGQLVSTNFYRGTYAAGTSREDQLVLAFDDWQADGLIKGAASVLDDEKMYRQFLLDMNKVTADEVRAWDTTLKEGAAAIAFKEAPLLISAFRGGDLSLLVDWPTEKLFSYNPNPYHRNRKPGDRWDTPLEEMNIIQQQLLDADPPVTKRRRFNFVSLLAKQTKKWLKDQKITWDVDYYGTKSEGQDRLKEADMVRVFEQDWGCLMPGYSHAGSGWWRARPLQVADAGSILIGDPKEMRVLYGDKNLQWYNAETVEKLDDGMLEDLARLQKEQLYDTHPLDKGVQQQELLACLES